jgi:hypothetical protein
VRSDQLVHERGHGIGVKRLGPLGGEDQAVVIGPSRASRLPFLCLAAAVVPKDGYGVLVEADDTRPTTFGGALNVLAAHDGARSAEGNLGGVEIHRGPAEVQEFATAGASVGSEPVEGIQLV